MLDGQSFSEHSPCPSGSGLCPFRQAPPGDHFLF
jgi:hypothetical protein